MSQTPVHGSPAGDQILLLAVMPAWFAGVTITIVDLAREAGATGPGLFPFVLAAFLGLPGAFVVVALVTRRRAGWRAAAGEASALAALSGYLCLNLILRLLPVTHPTVLAGLRLGLLALYVPAAAVMTPRLAGLGRLRLTAVLGLDRTRLSTLLLSLAVTALVTLPWPYTGALGDVLTSAEQALQSLALVLPSLLLVWGLTYSLLGQVFERSWLAALGAILAYVLLFVTDQLSSPDRMMLLRDAVVLVPLALLLAEFRAREAGLYPLLPLAWAGHAIPILFVDPRDVIARQGIPEFTHVLSYLAALLIAPSLGFVLWVGRKLFAYLQRQQTTPLLPAGLLTGLSALAAVAALAGWGAVYAVTGEPGFANDGFLILLVEQADLSGAEDTADREARLQYVYDALVETAERTQVSLRAELESLGVPYRPYYIQNMIRVDGHRWLMARFVSRPEVAQVVLNPNVRRYPRLIPIDIPESYAPPARPPANLTAIQAAVAWELGVTGQGVVVGGQDTGYDWTHPALLPHYRGWSGRVPDHDYSWHDAWDDTPAPFDSDSHGTHTMGTIVGDDGAGGRTGVAPGAKWIGCRSMRRGLGNPGAYAACMEFFLAPYPHGGNPFVDGDVSMAPHVVNNSWGCPAIEGCSPDTLLNAVRAMRAAGIMMVVGAGNEGPGCSTAGTPPANYDEAFSVGAANIGGQIAFFSSRGPVDGLVKPDVVAPGLAVLSTIPGGGYGFADGTSMASPHVAGLVALLWSANPALIGRIDETEALICRTARPRPVDDRCTAEEMLPREDLLAMRGDSPCACGDVVGVPNNVYGCGFIDAAAAVQQALEWR